MVFDKVFAGRFTGGHPLAQACHERFFSLGAGAPAVTGSVDGHSCKVMRTGKVSGATDDARSGLVLTAAVPEQDERQVSSFARWCPQHPRNVVEREMAFGDAIDDGFRSENQGNTFRMRSVALRRASVRRTAPQR